MGGYVGEYFAPNARNEIIQATKDAYEENKKYFFEKADIALKDFSENIKNFHVDDLDEELEKAINLVTSYKDHDILDEVQLYVLLKYSDDIMELDEYDETCDLQGVYQLEIDSYIDETILQMKEALSDYVYEKANTAS